MTSVAKKHKERIEEIHKALKDADLLFSKKVKLSKPKIAELTQCKWWESGCNINNAHKWVTLSHNGPYFTHLYEPYQPHGVPLYYEGKKIKLTPSEERVTMFYAQRIYQETYGNVALKFINDKEFNDNFFKDFRKYLTQENREKIKTLKGLDFSKIVQYIKDKKETKEGKEEKIAKRTKTEEKKKDYGYAMVNGTREPVSNFVVEPMAIFYGRGAHKYRGKIKPDVFPKDVIINIGKGEKIPTLPKGHQWKEVIHDQTLEWIASWTECVSGESCKHKYVRLGAEGQMKGKNDYAKYEKARKLNKFIDNVREKYESDIVGNDKKLKQLGTVLYFIDRHGIRVGTEKEGDTVGASTLLTDNIKLDKENVVTFDFLGKDSIRYFKSIKISPEIYKNLLSFTQNKTPKSLLFDRINAAEINSYLKSFDKNFSAKVFRTRLASNLIHEKLSKIKVKKDATSNEKKNIIDEVNILIATELNHKRTVSAKSQEAVEKLKEALKELKSKKKKLEKEGKSTSAVEKQIDNKQSQIHLKSNTQDIALTTSRQNYIDPRILVSWAKLHDLEMNKIYTKALQKKFQWAIDTIQKNWDYIDTPLNEAIADLEPGEKTSKGMKKSEGKAKTKRASKPKNSSDFEEFRQGLRGAKYGKSYIVYGEETKKLGKSFKALGGRWNPNLKSAPVKAAWIFPLSKLSDIKALLEGKNNKVPDETEDTNDSEMIDEVPEKEEKVIFDPKDAGIHIDPLPNSDKVELFMNNLHGVKYNKSYIVYGEESKEYADVFKKLGGRWNPNLKSAPVKAAWVFPPSQKKVIERYFAQKESRYFKKCVNCARGIIKKNPKLKLTTLDIFEIVSDESPFLYRFLHQSDFYDKINKNYVAYKQQKMK